MVARRDPAAACSYASRGDHTLLVLQGGGALGAYQAGVFEALSESGFAPDWVTGVSIGAVNAALIAGNPPGERVARLREFWDRVSSGMPLVAPATFDPLRQTLNLVSAGSALAFGVPGFFHPRIPPVVFAPQGSLAALSVYDAAPLRETLSELVRFDLINDKQTRFAVGTVDVRTGNSRYFDNYRPADMPIRVEHVMASGALPPGFAPVEIDGAYYWDGGLVSNSPLWHVMDDSPNLEALILQVDLFSARGEMPQNLDQAMERAKDIQYSSKTRFNTTRTQQIETERAALRRVLDRLPGALRDDPDVRLLTRATKGHKVSVVHLINRRFDHSTQAKDYEFSRATVRALWDAGRDAVHRSIASPQWHHACATRHGVQTYDLAR
ncbi:MAG: patatin-like phospholipase family protein [Burkholderiales bacterium]|nr:patatin-like phospholipase family protein [Burkholderiales bacterium]